MNAVRSPNAVPVRVYRAFRVFPLDCGRSFVVHAGNRGGARFPHQVQILQKNQQSLA
jgi:hypothetical protein